MPTELASNPSVLIAPALPVESAHVPFLQSVMAASGPGASRFGNGYGAGHWGGGASGSGGGGLGGGGAVPDSVDLPVETLLGGAGSERIGLLGRPAFDETGTAAGNSNGDPSNNGGSNGGGSNGGGSNGGGSNDGGSNGGGSNNGGPNDGDSNDGGSAKNGDFDPPGGGSGSVVDPWTVNPVADDTDQDPGPQGGTRSPAADVPEPGLMLLSGLGLAGALVRHVRARRG